MKWVAVLAFLVLAIPVVADDFMLAPLDRVPAEGLQFHADVASNATEILAVWRDDRGSSVDLVATRLRDDGTPVDPLGILVAENSYSPSVAAAGDDFVVTYGRDGGAWLTRIEDGRVAAAVSLGVGTPIDLATDGRSFCVLVSMQTSAAAVFTDAFGNIESSISLHGGAQQVIAVDGAYWVAIVSKSGVVSVTQLTSRGIRRTRRLGISGRRSVAIGAAGDRILAVWFGARGEIITADYVVLDADGNALMPVGHAEERSRSFGNKAVVRPSAAWDGHEFLLTWNDIDDCLRTLLGAVRIAPDGKAVPAGFPASTRYLATARHQGAIVVVTTDVTGEEADVFARSAPSFAAAPKAPKTLIAWSASSQEAPKTAAIGAVAMALWRQGRSPKGVTLALIKPDRRKQLIELTPAADGTQKVATLTASRDQFLAVWSETRAGFDEVRIFARRIAVDGTVRDRVPIELRPGGIPPVFRVVPAAASDGSNFLIVWEDGGRTLFAAFLTGNGKYVPPIGIPTRSSFSRMPVRAIWTGSLYAVIFADGNEVRMARITADGVLLDREPLLLAQEEAPPAIDAASDGNGHAMVVWTSGGCLRAVPLTANGIPAADPGAILCGPAPQRASVAAAWNGSGFTIYRAHGGLGRDTVLEALNVSVSLAPLGPERVLVGEGTGVFAPAAAALNHGVFLVYERIADGESGGVRRVFARAAPRRGSR